MYGYNVHTWLLSVNVRLRVWHGTPFVSRLNNSKDKHIPPGKYIIYATRKYKEEYKGRMEEGDA